MMLASHFTDTTSHQNRQREGFDEGLMGGQQEPFQFSAKPQPS